MQISQTQQSILSSKEANIMVSASAGCGKTTAMIGRIVNLILNEKIDLKNMLIITYTNAAAADIKEKLSVSLKQNAAGNLFVLKQLNYLPCADISTMHAFCSKVLKSYFYETNIEPKFEVLEDSAAKCLKIKAVNKVLKDYYENEDDAFSQLTEILSLNRSVSLISKVIIDLHEKSQCFFDNEFFKKVCLMASDVHDNEVLKFVNNYIAEFSQNAIQKLNDLYGRALIKSHRECILECADVLKCLNLKNTLEKNLEILSLLSFPSISPLKKEDKENFLVKDFHEEFKEFKKQLNYSLTNLKDKYPPFKEEELKTYAEKSKTLISKLLDILSEFENEYKLIKTESCGLDFSDLEKHTIEILKNDDILKELQNKYKYVFIDECQDINDVQDYIISKLAPKNLFSVGDVKQCIYRFRGAKPEIFINKCEGLKKDSQESFFRLGENYRTNSGLLEFVNEVFSDIIFKEFSLVDYQDTEKLIGKNKGRLSDGLKSVVVDIVDKKKIKKSGGEEETLNIYSVEDDSAVEIYAEQEGLLIVKRINELVKKNVEILEDEKYLKDNFRKSKIEYKDICILVRGKKGFAEKIFLTIKKSGIPISAEFKYPVREYEEIEELIQYLFLINNFYQDIPLLSVLKSPFYNFSDRELSLIKLKNDKDFHLCFFEYALDGTDKELKSKVSKFVKDLNKYRKFSEFNTVSALMELIISENKYEAKLLQTLDGPNKVSRVNIFIADLYGKIYEQNLYTFIQFINNFSDEIKIAASEISGNCVKINTIHQSKGLEYPVVILAGNQNEFNFKSAYEILLYHPEYGLAFKDYDLNERTVANTPVYQGLSQLIKYEQIKEEFNILYVAMTRARYRLYITGTLDKDKIKCAVTKFDIKNCSSPVNLLKFYGEWKDGKYYELCEHSDLTEEKSAVKTDFILQDKPINIDLEKIVNSRYEFSERLNTPFKLSVTEASKLFIETESVYNIKRVFEEDLTETGNLYHKILQNIDFKAKTDEAIEKELVRLKLIGIVREKLVEQNIDTENIKKFLNSKLLNNLEDAKIYRERPFMINIPHNEIRGNSKETVLVQGKIDLLIIKDNLAIIVDYKVSRKNSDYLLEKYREQLNIYAKAVKQILDVEKVEPYIYSVLKGELLAVG